MDMMGIDSSYGDKGHRGPGSTFLMYGHGLMLGLISCSYILTVAPIWMKATSESTQNRFTGWAKFVVIVVMIVLYVRIFWFYFLSDQHCLNVIMLREKTQDAATYLALLVVIMTTFWGDLFPMALVLCCLSFTLLISEGKKPVGASSDRLVTRHSI
eukprot:m.207773 g.207773  ORF g.207773 m.207773 type:complete len:156 (-) comp23936_c0_seq1:87-554(-)